MLRTSGPPSTAFRTALRRALLLAVAASATVFRASAQEAAERSTVTVTGTVVSDATGDPIAEVIVLVELLGLTFVTDAQGQFVFEEVPRGVYAIDLIHKDYERLEGDLSIDQPGSFVLAMTPTSGPGAGFMTGVVGVVTDQVSGDPVPEVVVNVPRAGRIARTGAEGRFSVGELAPGRHEIRFSHLGYAERTESVDVQMGPCHHGAGGPRRQRHRAGSHRSHRGQTRRNAGGPGVLSAGRGRVGLLRGSGGPGGQEPDRADGRAEPVSGGEDRLQPKGPRSKAPPTPKLRRGVFPDDLYRRHQDDRSWGMSINDMVDPSVVAGVEMYRGVAGRPAEYWGSSCGVVLIWLRRGESRRAR